MFPIAQEHVARVVLVDDSSILRAQQALWSVARLLVEPGAAAPLAALLSGAYVPKPDERVVVVLSGGSSSDQRTPPPRNSGYNTRHPEALSRTQAAPRARSSVAAARSATHPDRHALR